MISLLILDDVKACWSAMPWKFDLDDRNFCSRGLKADFVLSDAIAHQPQKGMWFHDIVMTSSNGNIFRVTDPQCGKWPGNSPHKGQWRGALIFSMICALNKRLSKQSRGWWFETPSRSLWRHCDVNSVITWHRCLGFRGGMYDAMAFTLRCNNFTIDFSSCWSLFGSPCLQYLIW